VESLQRAIEGRDADAVEALLAPGVVFRSPALFKPYVGRAATMVFLRAAMEVFEDFRYTRTFTDDAGGGSVMLFVATVDGKSLEGVDVISLGDDGLVTEFRVMVRPLSGLVALAEAMAPRVSGPLETLASE
jgi:SnoaL-like domain